MDISSCGDGSDCVDPVNEVGNTLARTLHIDIEQTNANEQRETGVFSLPSASNLVSAMKGGRGAAPKKLSVSWAADVYDPTPTSMSHTVTKKSWKNKPKNNKKTSSKKSHKGNSSRPKDKKHSRRERGSKQTNNYNDLGAPDSPSYCGTSLLNKSLANMHCPLAEAS